MKLYRGIRSEEFELLSAKSWQESRKVWLELIRSREHGNFRYPADLEDKIRDIARIAHLERQHFTDDRKIAERYAKAHKGILVELDVPVLDVVKHFRLEFQNFASRRKKFEIVYVVEAKVITRRARAWKLKVRK